MSKQDFDFMEKTQEKREAEAREAWEALDRHAMEEATIAMCNDSEAEVPLSREIDSPITSRAELLAVIYREVVIDLHVVCPVECSQKMEFNIRVSLRKMMGDDWEDSQMPIDQLVRDLDPHIRFRPFGMSDLHTAKDRWRECVWDIYSTLRCGAKLLNDQELNCLNTLFQKAYERAVCKATAGLSKARKAKLRLECGEDQ